MEEIDPPPRPAHEARRRLWIGLTLAVVAAAGGALAVAPGTHDLLARLRGAPEARPVVTLEFSAAEVVRPTYASLPVLIDFSGPLVAPRTAVVRAKAAGTLLALRVSEGSRVAGRPGARRDRSRRTCRRAWPSAMRSSIRRMRPCRGRAPARGQRRPGERRASSRRPRLQSSEARLEAARAQLRSAAGAARRLARRHPGRGAGGADHRHRRQAPRRAGREGQCRAAGRDDRRPVDRSSLRASSARTRSSLLRPVRPWRSASKGAEPAVTAGSTGSRRPPSRDARDRRRRRARQPGGALPRRPVRTGAASSSTIRSSA